MVSCVSLQVVDGSDLRVPYCWWPAIAIHSFLSPPLSTIHPESTIARSPSKYIFALWNEDSMSEFSETSILFFRFLPSHKVFSNDEDKDNTNTVDNHARANL
jgi:hypothetical protein